jgi:hypothetical protein
MTRLSPLPSGHGIIVTGLPSNVVPSGFSVVEGQVPPHP